MNILLFVVLTVIGFIHTFENHWFQETIKTGSYEFPLYVSHSSIRSIHWNLQIFNSTSNLFQTKGDGKDLLENKNENDQLLVIIQNNQSKKIIFSTNELNGSWMKKKPIEDDNGLLFTVNYMDDDDEKKEIEIEGNIIIVDEGDDDSGITEKWLEERKIEISIGEDMVNSEWFIHENNDGMVDISVNILSYRETDEKEIEDEDGLFWFNSTVVIDEEKKLTNYFSLLFSGLLIGLFGLSVRLCVCVKNLKVDKKKICLERRKSMDEITILKRKSDQKEKDIICIYSENISKIDQNVSKLEKLEKIYAVKNDIIDELKYEIQKRDNTIQKLIEKDLVDSSVQTEEKKVVSCSVITDKFIDSELVNLKKTLQLKTDDFEGEIKSKELKLKKCFLLLKKKDVTINEIKMKNKMLKEQSIVEGLKSGEKDVLSRKLQLELDDLKKKK